ncbi:MAG: acyl carrier protein [Myxococcales bacterium]|nr:acyl carrier protein [Myxococcales bacterium]
MRGAASDVEARVRAAVVALVGVPAAKVTLDARLREDLGADSLDLVELLMALEGEFGGEISDAEAEAITTVAGAVAFIEARLRGD